MGETVQGQGGFALLSAKSTSKGNFLYDPKKEATPTAITTDPCAKAHMKMATVLI